MLRTEVLKRRTSLRLANRTCIASFRGVTTAAAKKEGDISDSFVQLSGQSFKPLEPRFAEIKKKLIYGHEDALEAAWKRLLRTLREEVPLVASLGPEVIPQIDYVDIDRPSEHFTKEHKKRGVAVIRNVLSQREALELKSELRSYIRDNPHTKAFPQVNPQVYELYWSKSQIRARSHPNLLRTQRFLMSHWHSSNPEANISIDHPTAYADRVRMRQPGDAKFALSAHVDGGSCERWEANGYGLGRVYDAIFRGDWESYDPWEASCRLPVVSDLYQGAGACSVFRMYQGWLSMPHIGPGEGTLLVNPLLGLATSYYLLRPFFEAKRSAEALGPEFLEPSNWRLQREQDSWLHGATPGHGQELTAQLHPHLDLDHSMVHVPKVAPGDYVAWHCDTIHAVDKVHAGSTDSSVLYIPSCPLTELNARHMDRQRDTFMRGVPGPDFPGGEGEANHIGRLVTDDVAELSDAGGLRAFGLKAWDSTEPGLTQGQREVMDRSNKILGFYQ
ncbi:MAG: hypothetical protein M1828_002910 [Chrysothrix sp. TS-e1954]|nr:MAG: hypothetical protein M1828_002910 [Chrysothrix sp. TS-e1954]